MYQEIRVSTAEDCRRTGLNPRILRRQAQNTAKQIIGILGVDRVAGISTKDDSSAKDVTTTVFKRHPRMSEANLIVEIPRRLELWARAHEVERARSEVING